MPSQMAANFFPARRLSVRILAACAASESRQRALKVAWSKHKAHARERRHHKPRRGGGLLRLYVLVWQRGCNANHRVFQQDARRGSAPIKDHGQLHPDIGLPRLLPLQPHQRRQAWLDGSRPDGERAYEL